MKSYRLHLLGLSHLPVSEKYHLCAYTQKIVKLSKMLLSLGHEVFLYGAEGTDIPCTEFIQTHTLKDIRDSWGSGDNRYEIGYPWDTTMFRHDWNAPPAIATVKFREVAIAEINKRKKEDDFLLLPMGTFHKPIADAVGLYLTCEPGIGYRGSYTRFKAFESAYMMNFTYGGDHPRESINGDHYSRVIPNYWDAKDFTFSPKPKDYYLYIGRLIGRKGVRIAVQVAEYLGIRLILAGQTHPEVNHYALPKNCEFIGSVNPAQRDVLMGGAIATFVPTLYLEPFGGVHVESRLTGTPVITTNFGCFVETTQNAVDGYRCDTFDDFVWAAKQAPKLDRSIVRQRAERYLMDNVRWDYQKWFDDLYSLYESVKTTGKGWPEVRAKQPEWREKITW